MSVCHPEGYSAHPADWHLCTGPQFSRWDGSSYKKEMLSVSGRLCPAKPCGSSAAVLRGWGPGRGNMVCACKLPDELSAFSNRNQLGRGLGKAISSTPRHTCSEFWSTTSCERVAQGRGPIASPPMCKELATWSSYFFSHIRGVYSLVFWVFFMFTKPQWWLKDTVLQGRDGSRGSGKEHGSMWGSGACRGDPAAPAGQAAWKYGISGVVFCSLDYKLWSL